VPCITFDQPLWLKAVEVVATEEMNIVCCLGGFHMLMSFLGSIGHVMAGAGLAEALEIVYGTNVVSRMLSGKAYARAVRGRLLVESALHVLLLRCLLDPEDCCATETGMLSKCDIEELRRLYDNVVECKCDVDGTVSDGDAVENVVSNEVLLKLDQLLCDMKTLLCVESRTAKLWLQYLHYVSVLKTFIHAERMGNFHLHLASVSHMLNIFAATGHSHYAKSAHLYLQSMVDLEATHEWLYAMFTVHGYHSVRRSDRLWTGLSCDLVIEQVMMRSLKSRGGLTHGRGMTESVRLQWVHSMHKCASVHASVVNLCGLEKGDGSVQHAELGKSRSVRDYEDLTKMVEWFVCSNPFETSDPRLRSLGSGMVAAEDDKINCDVAEDVGAAIMKRMDNLVVSNAQLRKVDQVRTLIHLEKHPQVADGKVIIDPNTLFSRLLVILERSENMESYFQYELTTVPMALFSKSLLRKTNKALLGKELMKQLDDGDRVADGCYSK